MFFQGIDMQKKMSYPLDIDFILRKKKKIKKDLLNKKSFLEIKIAILGGSTTSEIKNILELFLLNNGVKPNFYESEYNKFYEDAIFGTEELDQFRPDIIYIHTTNKNILTYPSIKDSSDRVKELLSLELERYELIWKSLSRYNCAIIQNNFEYPLDRPLGNLDSSLENGKSYFINYLNREFNIVSSNIKNLYINDINYLSSYLGLQNWFDRSLWYQAKYALSMDCIPELAFNISKIINSLVGKSKKCLILDLDNTCWGGVIGDDGLNSIQIGLETPIAESYTDFQKYVKELSNAGVTLAICSKNDFENARNGFTHPDTILEFEDFASFKANWDNKDLNIVKISDEMNIGVDSMVFIDDNPMEREIVLSQVSSVAVPDIGKDSIEFIDHIDKNGYFESVFISDDDVDRKKYYINNKNRLKNEKSFNSYDDFLESLDMIAEIKTFTPIYLDRITQLANKTNQFNLTTKRYNSGEIKKIFHSNDYIKIYGKLTDKFGDNGLISITIANIKSNTCHIELLAMSCRVLKRGMEFSMFDELVKLCKIRGVTDIIGYYYSTPKNSMVSDLYEKLGFELIEGNQSDTIWKLKVINYISIKSYIRVTNG
jgi:FkbH-like protein